QRGRAGRRHALPALHRPRTAWRRWALPAGKASLGLLCGELHCIDDFLISGAATEIARQRFADAILARGLIGLQKTVRRDDHPRRADPALGGAAFEERL